MSSIYDALQRLQQAGGEDAKPLPLNLRSRRPLKPAGAAGIIALSVGVIVAVALLVIHLTHPKPAQPVSVQAAPVNQTLGPAPAFNQPPVASDPAAILAEARQLKAQGDLAAAAAAYKRLVDKNSDDLDVYLELGALQVGAGNLDEAMVAYDKGLSIHRDEPRLLNNMGTILLKKGEFSSAAGYFEQAQAKAPDYVEPVYNQACAYARLGEKRKAMALLKKACAMNPAAASWAAGDSDLKPLAGQPEFDALVNG